MKQRKCSTVLLLTARRPEGQKARRPEGQKVRRSEGQKVRRSDGQRRVDHRGGARIWALLQWFGKTAILTRW